MTGRLLVIVIGVAALLAAAGMYYLQVYAYYREIPAAAPENVALMPREGAAPRPLPFAEFRGIDADSSPIRYRACFTTEVPLAELAGTYRPYPDAAPRVAPGWFDCFDAEALGAEIAAGRAEVFLAARNIEYGIDRVIAVTEAGRGYIWHEVNDCGDKAYDGSPLDPDCPPRP
ncbi:DUF6446 family protein [Roseivivax sp. CAU 1761]